MEHTTKAAEGSYDRQSQQTSAIPRPTAPLFPSWRVLANIGKGAIVGQAEPTIVVAVIRDIARVHGTHHKGSRRQLRPPITTNISHTKADCLPFSFVESVGVGKYWQMGHCGSSRANHCCG